MDITKLAGLSQVMKQQASQLLGQVEALIGLTAEDTWLEAAKKDLAAVEGNILIQSNVMAFKAVHERIQEITPRVKGIIAGLSIDNKAKYEKRAEKKVQRAALNHRENLQRELDQLTASMPDAQKLALQ